MAVLRNPTYPPAPSAYGYSSIAPPALPAPLPPVRPATLPQVRPVAPTGGPPDLTGMTDGSVGGPGYTGYGLQQPQQAGGIMGWLQSLFGAGQGTNQGMTGMLRGGGDGRDFNR